MADEELFPIVTPDGQVVGRATRRQCHGGTMLLHPVVHLHVVGRDGKLYLQKRSLNKDIQPGRWDTAVGGHVDYGEAVGDALRREAREELGLQLANPDGAGAGAAGRITALTPYVFQSDRERELVNTFIVKLTGDVAIAPDPVEISEGRFWTVDEVDAALGKGVFTPNFEQEYRRIRPAITDNSI